MTFEHAIRRYNSDRRAADLQLLWPVMCDVADGDLQTAREMFMLHVANNSAWKEVDDMQIELIVNNLQLPRVEVDPPAAPNTPEG